MKISERLAKWAYAWNVVFDREPYEYNTWTDGRPSWERRNYPTQINLCNLFWRTFVLTPALILAGLGIGTLLLLGLKSIALEALIFVVASTTLVGLGMAIAHYFPAWVSQAILDRTDKIGAAISPVFKAVKAAKTEVCPYFEVEKSDG